MRIVQFDHIEDRGCGAAVELGWRYSRGQYIYVLDADMLLQPGFLQQALAYLAAHPRVAAAGGNLVDISLNTPADHQRARVAAALVEPRAVSELGGGGLYRRDAVLQAGYLAHRSLAAYEEAELGARLRSLGWTLVRLPQTAVLHEGHAETSRQMLARLWANGRAKSAATFLLSAYGHPWFRLVVRKLAYILVIPAMHAVSMVLAVIAGWQLGFMAALLAWAGWWLSVVLILAIFKRSISLAVWRVFFWHYLAAGTIAGMRISPADPRSRILAREISTSSAGKRDSDAVRVVIHV